MVPAIRLIYWSLIMSCSVIFLIGRESLLAQEKKFEQSQGLSIFNVSASSPSFNPSRGEKVELRYRLSRSAAVTVKVFDPDSHLIRTLADKSHKQAGAQREIWDGKDIGGKILPNEAYFFTVEAEDSSGGRAIYDPITFSGGEPFDLTEASFNREAGTLTYKLSQPSRVLIRVGMPGGALLKTIADWEPRISGEITEYWNGKDEDNLIDVWKNPDYRTLIAYFTLPETSVITFGNSSYDYRTYKANLPSAQPKKPERPMVNRRKLSPHFLTSRAHDRSFRVLLTFPELETPNTPGDPVVKDRVLVRVDVDRKNRDVIHGRQFEVIFFVNTVYFAEEERGYVPFNFPWELKQLPAGEHILTVNLVTSHGQFGVASRKVKVVK